MKEKEINSLSDPKPTLTCCLCGKEFLGYGNNPQPLADVEERCCDECNWTKVLPARGVLMTEEIRKEIKRAIKTALLQTS